MKNTRKGFTLVELLAVIVILAIIMIIAIPAVLSTMEQARQKTFAEYVTKVHNTANNFYLKNRSFDTDPKGVSVSDGTNTCYIYTLAEIGMTSTGDYEGSAAVCTFGTDEIKVFVRLSDKNYHNMALEGASGWWNFTDAGEPAVDRLATGKGNGYATIPNKDSDTEKNAALAALKVAKGQSKSTTKDSLKA